MTKLLIKQRSIIFKPKSEILNGQSQNRITQVLEEQLPLKFYVDSTF